VNSILDRLIIHFDGALRTSTGFVDESSRASPAETLQVDNLKADEQHLSARLLRSNHSAEVCARAVYHGQSLTANSSRASRSLDKAASEEKDHLYWCESRIKKLDSHMSYLNPLLYGSSFCAGAIAGLLGDRINLGLMAETSNQRDRHLDRNLNKLPQTDLRTRAIVTEMKRDLARHQVDVQQADVARLPSPVKNLLDRSFGFIMWACGRC